MNINEALKSIGAGLGMIIAAGLIGTGLIMGLGYANLAIFEPDLQAFFDNIGWRGAVAFDPGSASEVAYAGLQALIVAGGLAFLAVVLWFLGQMVRGRDQL